MTITNSRTALNSPLFRFLEESSSRWSDQPHLIQVATSVWWHIRKGLPSFLIPLFLSSFMKTEIVLLHGIMVYTFTNLCFLWNLGLWTAIELVKLALHSGLYPYKDKIFFFHVSAPPSSGQIFSWLRDAVDFILMITSQIRKRFFIRVENLPQMICS